MINQENTASAEDIKNVHLIPYNTSVDRLLLSEYGRHIQDMVAYCLSIEDREERNVCAAAIVDAMATVAPENIGPGGDRKKLWDHLNLISGFRLDIDWPVDVASEETSVLTPRPLPYSPRVQGMRHYGRIIEQMARKVAEMENSPEKDVAVSMVANHIKKLLVMNNPQSASDARALRDLAFFTEGAIDLTPESFPLHEFPDFESPIQKIKKKKRK